DVANMRRGPTTDVHNLTSCAFRSLFINIHEPHPCTFLRKSLRNGLAYAAGGPGNNRRFAVKPLAIGLLRCVRQWKAPPFREMKSSTRSSCRPAVPPSSRSLQPERGILSHANAARRSRKDYCARKQRRALAEKLDQGRHVVNHVARRCILHNAAVYLRLNS